MYLNFEQILARTLSPRTAGRSLERLVNQILDSRYILSIHQM